MTRTGKLAATACALALSMLPVAPVRAQGAEGEDPSPAILALDASFWQAYNRCDHAATREFIAEDVEFYHDKGGPTLGQDALVASIRDNLCRNPAAFRLRREPVEGTVRVFPLKKGSTVYGAILSGEHLFYLSQDGKPEVLDGRARFTHLWLLKDGRFTMARILSFDHGPAVKFGK
jgi:hypothetical protein